jgi:hypothetical protein
MKSLFLSTRAIWLVLLAGVALSLAGCSTPDSELSSRPWNAPKSWEHGLPSGMTEGR